MSASAALAGALIGGGGTYLVQNSEFNERRDAEVRVKRQAVYSGFLKAANSYAVESEDAATCPARDRSCLSAFDTARYVYQGALNEIYVYGSDEGFAAAQEISKDLPGSLVGLGYGQPGPVRDAEFTDSYQRLLAIMCQEATAEPREGC